MIPRVGLPGGAFWKGRAASGWLHQEPGPWERVQSRGCSLSGQRAFSTGGIAASRERRSHQSGALRHQAEIAQAFVFDEQVADQIAEKYLEEHAFLKHVWNLYERRWGSLHLKM